MSSCVVINGTKNGKSYSMTVKDRQILCNLPLNNNQPVYSHGTKFETEPVAVERRYTENPTNSRGLYIGVETSLCEMPVIENASEDTKASIEKGLMKQAGLNKIRKGVSDSGYEFNEIRIMPMKDLSDEDKEVISKRVKTKGLETIVSQFAENNKYYASDDEIDVIKNNGNKPTLTYLDSLKREYENAPDIDTAHRLKDSIIEREKFENISESYFNRTLRPLEREDERDLSKMWSDGGYRLDNPDGDWLDNRDVIKPSRRKKQNQTIDKNQLTFDDIDINPEEKTEDDLPEF